MHRRSPSYAGLPTESQQDVEPAVVALLRAAKDLAGIAESIDITPLPDSPARNVPVLSLGPMDRPVFNHVVNAPSVAALMSKNDSLTRLSDALKLLAGGITLPKMEYRVLQGYGGRSHILGTLDTDWARLCWTLRPAGDVEVDRPVYARIISLALYNGNGKVIVIPEELLRDADVEMMLGQFVKHEPHHCPQREVRHSVLPRASSHGSAV